MIFLSLEQILLTLERENYRASNAVCLIGCEPVKNSHKYTRGKNVTPPEVPEIALLAPPSGRGRRVHRQCNGSLETGTFWGIMSAMICHVDYTSLGMLNMRKNDSVLCQ
jgi:hypothetical protein